MEDTRTPGHRPWKKSILTGGALSAAWWPCPLFTWSNSISLALNLFILIWTTPPGLNVTSAIPPFICSVGPGNQFMLLDPDVFFAPFFVVGSSNFSSPLLIYRSIYSFSFPCRLKMARKPRCQDTPKDKKKNPSCPPPGTVVEAHMRNRRLAFLKRRLWGNVLRKYIKWRLMPSDMERNQNQETRSARILGSAQARCRRGWPGKWNPWVPHWEVLEGEKCSLQVGFKWHRCKIDVRC